MENSISVTLTSHILDLGSSVNPLGSNFYSQTMGLLGFRLFFVLGS